MVIEYRTRELNMGPLPEGAGVLPLGHRGSEGVTNKIIKVKDQGS